MKEVIGIKHKRFDHLRRDYICDKCGKKRTFPDRWLVTCTKCKNKNKRT